MSQRAAPGLIGICWDSEEHFWFEVDRLGEPCPEDIAGDRVHEVTYYRRVVSDDGEQD